MIKLVALMGKAGSGKDRLLTEIINRDEYNHFQKVINCTTRPIREHEVDGVNYHYLTNEEFTEKVLNGDMIEATNFNHWFYGTMLSTLSTNKINIGVFNPTAVEILQADPRLDVYVIYVEAPDKLRLLRQLNREEEPDCHEIVRRFKADEEDFNDNRILNGIQPAFGIYNDEMVELSILVPVVMQTIYKRMNDQGQK
jgi:guanylate kinase